MKGKRIWSGLLALVFCLGLLPATALAAGDFTVKKSNGETVTGSKNANNYTTEYTVAENVTVTGSTRNERLIATANSTITLKDVSMDLDWCKGSPIEIAEGASATLILEGENTLSAFADGPGILVNQGATVTIQSQSDDNTDRLTVSGAKAGTYVSAEMGGGGGSITTDGYAGIGGPNFDEATNYTGAINIESGTITATGYSYGAGIGGGNFSSGGTINISGGVVTALSGGTDPDGWVSVPADTQMGAGIGGSQGCGSGDINISGGIVKAYGGYGCPGIGGAPCDVTISGNAEVTGYGGDLAAGIGGYDKDKGESNEVTISDTATVTACGGKGAAGLGEGSGDSAAQFTLTIASGANVTAYSDGAKAAMTGTPTPTPGSAPVVNMKFDPDLTIPSQVGDISLTLTGTEASNTKTLTVPKGYRAAAATLPAGIYSANATIGQEIPLLGLEGAPIESSPDYAKVVLVSIPQVPSAPQDLEAVSGDGEVTLTWRAPEKAGTGPVTGYTVCWSTTKPTGENPTSGDTLETKADVTTATVTNLTNGTTYYFWVVANNHAGTGAASETAAAIPLAPGGAVQVDSADGLKAALENDAVTDIEVVGSFAYDDSIPQEKNITIKSSMTLTLQYSSGFYTPYGATVCNSNIRVEQGGTIAFMDTCWWSFSSPSLHSYLLMNGAFTLEEGASAIAKNDGDSRNTKPGYILFRGDFTNNGSFVNEATTGTKVYLNYGTAPGVFTDNQTTGFSPKYNLCISTPSSIESPKSNDDLANLAIPLTGIEGGAYVGGQLKAVVDGFGSVEQGGPFSVIWNDTGAATNEPYTVQETDKGQQVTAALDGNGELGQDYGYFLVSETENGSMAYQIFKFSTTSVSEQIADFAVKLDVNGGDTVEESVLIPNAEGKLSVLPTPTRSNHTFDGWFTAATGGEKVTTDTVFTQDTTIYAHWTAVSSGGSSRPTYPPTVTDTAGGDTSVAPARPHKGDTVTITPKPDQGNEVDSVTVTDRNGDPVKVTDKGDGTYTFTQPTGKVTISVTFRDKETPGLPFVDVAPDTWYFDAVRYAYENSLMVGTSPTAFSPNGMTTRAQIVTILWRLVDSPAGEAPVDFADVDPAAWYGEAVRWAAGQGIVGGYGNGSFGPNDPVTREQLAAILYRFAQHMGYDTEGQADLSGFTDLAQVSTYAREAMAWCVDAGLLSGTSPTTLSPRGQATRAQTAAVLMRLCQGYGM